MTLSWLTLLEFEPPLVGCVISKRDHSFAAVAASGECVINIPSPELADAVVLLRRVLKPRLIATYVVVVASGILLTEYAVRLAGRLSTMLAVVSVLGPALPITIVKLVVPPTATVVLPTVLLRLGVTTTPTVPGAVAVVLPRLVTLDSGVNVTVFV